MVKTYWFTRFALVLIFLSLISEISYSTHIRAGEITVERVNCQSLTFRFTILGYRDTGSPDNIQFGGGFFDFGDGQDPITIPTAFTSVYIGNEVERNVYVLEHTYTAAGTYIIGYREQNRNDGVLNIDNSVDTPFYVETKIVIDPFLGCNNSPILLIPPIDEGCTQVAFFHNPGAYDPDGDSLSYEMVIPKQDRNVYVANYRDPHLAEFYPGDYNKSDESGTKKPNFSINPSTGEVKWD
ncbi:MAG: gliding motility-associated C-terminal domain-containing protein, partial [Cyclobacteriaceae bacterium]|nr:gliding motility-associated C-terminal domain-containing protein [Cyclobacteriaceae bacterium]